MEFCESGSLNSLLEEVSLLTCFIFKPAADGHVYGAQV
jgi:hypothetical protein